MKNLFGPLLTCFFLLLLVQAKAACEMDSARTRFLLAANDSLKIRTLLEAGWNCRYERTQEAVVVLQEALLMAGETGVQSMNGNLYMALGNCYYYRQNYTRALDSYFKGLPYSKKYGNEYITASLYMNIGNVYNAQKNFGLSKSFYVKSLHYINREKEYDMQVNIYNNLGMIEGQTANYDAAISYLLKAVEIAERAGLIHESANCLNNLGISYTFKKEYGKALENMNKALGISTRYGDSRAVANSLSDIANVYVETGDHKKAIANYEKALKEASRTQYLYLIAVIYEKMSELSYQTKDYKKAYEYHKLFKQINDTLFSSEKGRQIEELNTQYESDKKDQEISLLRTENTFKEELAQRRAWIILLCMAALIVGGVLALLLNKNIKEKNQANKLLREKNLLVTTQKTEIEKQKKELENYTAELEKENIIAQYETLKNQVNPHFLFNSLNVLASLIKKQPEQAYVFAREFAKIYRVALSLKENLLIHLNEEMDFVQSYIYLQKMRFGESLHVSINIPDEYATFFIPPFSVQMIIENAIKHNIISETSPLFIEVYCEGRTLMITNNLQRRTDNTSSTGIGSKNLVQRYSLISQEKPEFLNDEKAFTVHLPLIVEE